MWFALAVAGFATRGERLGVTSFVRCLGLKAKGYDSLLRLFHSPAVNLEALSRAWLALLLKAAPSAVTDNGRICIVGDGIKRAKSGRKMPAVKRLHQSSESNTKPEFIMGHSLQALGLLCKVGRCAFCIPLIGRIHEGIVLCNAHKTTQIDRMMLMAISLLGSSLKAILILDAYYCSGKVVKSLFANGHHLVTRCRSATVAYLPLKPGKQPKGRGRPRMYGAKIRVVDHLLGLPPVPMKIGLYGEKSPVAVCRFADLLWRPSGRIVRFVLIDHPARGRILLMATDIGMAPERVAELYSYRFKIEVSFKQSIHTVGAYQYHFWMKTMDRIKRSGGDQRLHRKPKEYRNKVARKIHAYHCHVQTAMIAQGMLQLLSARSKDSVWDHFGSWLRTSRSEVLPSEYVCSTAMRNALPEYLAADPKDAALQIFLKKQIDPLRAEGARLLA